MGILTKIFGTRSDREIKRILPLVDCIEAMADEYKAKTDGQLKAKTAEFKERLSNGETLEDVLPEAFATAREAADRVLGKRPFRVQVLCGIVLHQGRIAEMKTGEGKTLVAAMPSYLNALTGNGVHIVTVNDYLAKRDFDEIGKIHKFLGMNVGLIVHGLNSNERRAAYEADITYGTNNEMGFDYLRDNMAIYKNDMVQRGHAYAIVDEVDSILIDEARTPLIISGHGDESTDLYEKVEQFVSRLKRLTFASTDEKQEESEDIDADYIVDEKAKSSTLTARGIAKAEAHFGLENLSDLNNSTLSHHINQAIKAHGIMHGDVDYVVKDGEIIIVDEFTGRLMHGRRYSEGLHQAIEAKEKVKVAAESKTLATITFQNYFRMYQKLAGMTGTALTEAEEFSAIYNLDIVVIPTNRPMIRIDNNDVIYKNENGKNQAIIAQIEECNKKGQPVLVGTISIEKSEGLSALLKKKGIRHNVLNAKHHEKEAEIIAQAGKINAVTIATNMAGRGTDIQLGGNAEYMARNDLRKAEYSEEIIIEATGYAETDNEEVLAARQMYKESIKKHNAQIGLEAEKVKEAGGLFILGTERHESRRIDNQLRGRSGRQGDPGESRFFISMTDDIMRLFGSERVIGMMEALGVEDDTPIDQKMLTNAIEQAQKKVESRNFQSRKTVLEYDDVMNLQREKTYGQRKMVLDGEDVSGSIKAMISDVIKLNVFESMGENGYITDPEHLGQVLIPFERIFLKKGEISPAFEELNAYSTEKVVEIVEEKALSFYAAKEKRLGLIEGTQTPLMRELERVILLRVVDEYWMEHIDAMHELRRGIGLRAYGQINPLDEYKREGFDMYETMVNGIKDEVVRRLFVVEVKRDQQIERKRVSKNSVENIGGDGPVKKQPVRTGKKIGRNEPCPCGSGKKYKNCCGRNA